MSGAVVVVGVLLVLLVVFLMRHRNRAARLSGLDPEAPVFRSEPPPGRLNGRLDEGL